MKLLVLSILLCVFYTTDCSRILVVYPAPTRSHFILGSALARGLAEAGHDVTIISPYKDKNLPKNGTYRNIVLTGVDQSVFTGNVSMNVFDMVEISPFIMTLFLGSISGRLSRAALEHPNVQELLNSNEQFDVVILEQFYNDALKGIASHFDAPLILVNSMFANAWVNPLVGNPSPPSYIPDSYLRYTSNMNFFQRTYNWLYTVYSEIYRHLFYFPSHNKLMKEFFPEAPDLDILLYNASLVLLNGHESTSLAVPLVPNLINVGGFHISPPKKLPEDIKSFLDSAKEGVVYFSMGSNLNPSDMPLHKKEAILKALGKLKQKVLWKWDEDTLPGKPDNVKLGKWFPQADLLAHPNIKLFITHGGLLSATETIYHGVPILSIPIFADQKMNAARAELNGFGLSLSFGDLTEEKLSEALHKLLNDPKYRENAQRRSKLFHDRPIKPMDLVIYWTEYVIRHRGAPHLRVAGVDLPWYKYLLLDVIAFLILTVATTVIVLVVLIKKVCNLRKNRKVKVKKS